MDVSTIQKRQSLLLKLNRPYLKELDYLHEQDFLLLREQFRSVLKTMPIDLSFVQIRVDYDIATRSYEAIFNWTQDKDLLTPEDRETHGYVDMEHCYRIGIRERIISQMERYFVKDFSNNRVFFTNYIRELLHIFKNNIYGRAWTSKNNSKLLVNYDLETLSISRGYNIEGNYPVFLNTRNNINQSYQWFITYVDRNLRSNMGLMTANGLRNAMHDGFLDSCGFQLQRISDNLAREQTERRDYIIMLLNEPMFDV